MMRILSLGAGVQSSTLALMADTGALGEKPEAAIFADTQGEPKAVYEWLDWLERQLSFPVYRATRGSLWEAATTVKTTRDGQRSYVPIGIPVFTIDGLNKKGMGKRQCTRTYKIEVIQREAKRLLGKKRIRASDGVLVEMWIGISTDEAQRAKPNAAPWVQARWPLLEKGISRADCLRWMAEKGYPTPPRSACTYCPYHDDAAWLALTPLEFQDAIIKERQLQDAYAKATAIKSKPFFHSSRVPLNQVEFSPRAHDPNDENTEAVECEGMCGL